MTASILAAGTGQSVLAAGTAVHAFCVTGITNGLTTEGTNNPVFRTAGNVRRLSLYVSANSITASSTVKVRVNGVDGNNTLTIGSGATGRFTDTTNSDSIAAGDRLSVGFTGGATGTSLTFRIISAEFVATSSSDTVSKLVNTLGGTTGTAGATRYLGLAAGGTASTLSTTEAQTQQKIRFAGTMRNLQVSVSANARTSSTTFGNRINGANGSLSVTVGAGATGTFEDTSNSNSLSVNDLVNHYLTWGINAGGMTIASVGSDIISTSRDGVVAYCASAASLITGTSTTYASLMAAAEANGTEANTQMRVPFDCTFQNMQVYIAANPQASGTRSITFRKGAADTALTFTIGASATGRFEDTSNTVSAVAGDLINLKAVGGATGNVTATQAVVHYTVASSDATGTGAITEAADTMSASGLSFVNATGTVAVTETGDTGSGSGTLRITGTTAATETGDTGSGSGVLRMTGTAAATESSDTVTGSGTLRVTGTASPTETADTASGSGTLRITGTASATEAGDSMSASGQSVQNDATGTVAATEGSDTASGSATLTVTGTGAITESSDTGSGSGSLLLTGTASASESGDSGTGSASVIITGSAASSEGSDTASGTATLTVNGSTAATEDNDTGSGTGDTVFLITGLSAVTEQGDSASASGLLVVTGTAGLIEAGDTFGSAGSLLVPSGQNVIRVRAETRILVVQAEARVITPANDNRVTSVPARSRVLVVAADNRRIAA